MTKQQQIFEPLLRQFEKASSELPIRKQIAHLFIPTVGPNYFEASRKVFYIGRDSNEWDVGDLEDYISRNCVDEYLENSTEFINDQGYLHYNKNKSSGFWSAVIRLHLRMKGITDYVKVSLDMPDEYKDLLFDFGYGNTNSIEVPKTLMNHGIWNSLDTSQYFQLKSHSRHLDKMIHILDAFDPDMVFIFNWDCNEAEYLEGLEYEIRKLPHINNKCWGITLHNRRTKIIWTAHPGSMLFEGYTASDMAEELHEYLVSENLLNN